MTNNNALQITEADLIQVARNRFQSDENFQLQVKMMSLIRMLEAANQRIAELESDSESPNGRPIVADYINNPA